MQVKDQLLLESKRAQMMVADTESACADLNMNLKGA